MSSSSSSVSGRSSNVECSRCEARSPSRGAGSPRRSSSAATQYSRIPASAFVIASRPAGSPLKPLKKSSTHVHEEVGVGGVHAGHAQERLRREAQAELGDEVALAARRDVLDELPAEGAHGRLGRLHRARREPRVDDPAVLDVVGRVDLRRHEAVDRIRLPWRDRLAGEQLGRLVDVAHRVVAREHPVALRERVEVHRARLAQLVAELPVAAGRLLGGEVAMHDRAAAQVAPDRLVVDRHVGHVVLPAEFRSWVGTSRLKRRAALRPRMLRFACSPRNGRWRKMLGRSKSQCGQSDA